MDDFWDNTPDLDLPETQDCQKKRNPRYRPLSYMSFFAARGVDRTGCPSKTPGGRSGTISARVVVSISNPWKLITRLRRIKNRWSRKLNHHKNKRI